MTDAGLLGWAWQASREIDPSFKGRSRFVLAALRENSLARQLMAADRSTAVGALLAEWPQTLGNLVWPYQCAAWDAKTRFDRISRHFDAVEQVPGLRLAPDEKLVLADLSAFSEGSSLILDRPQWLAREGHLSLSLFKGNFRAFTISFSLSGSPPRELFIGGIQGRQDADILAVYRDLTKDFHGVRPRDFLLEALRLFAIGVGVERIFAVADAHKITRHAYFGKKDALGLDYDEVWRDRGGIRVADTHFELPIGGNRRPLDEIAAKKRSMYRRRYQMLDEISAALPTDLRQAERRRFEAS